MLWVSRGIARLGEEKQEEAGDSSSSGSGTHWLTCIDLAGLIWVG